MSIARKIFIGRVLIPPGAVTSLYAMMRDSGLHWGFETTALTTPSLDSIIGSNCTIVADSAVKVGSDAATMPATGITKAGAVAFELSDFGPDFGIIDPNAIFFFAAGGVGMDVIFTAR